MPVTNFEFLAPILSPSFPETPMDLQSITCPRCGGMAALLQVRDEFEEIPDLGRPEEKARIPVKVEEFRCQEPTCEHEFERILREPIQ